MTRELNPDNEVAQGVNAGNIRAYIYIGPYHARMLTAYKMPVIYTITMMTTTA